MKDKEKKSKEQVINYTDAIKQNLSDIISRRDFSYNPENDAVFSSTPIRVKELCRILWAMRRL